MPCRKQQPGANMYWSKSLQNTAALLLWTLQKMPLTVETQTGNWKLKNGKPEQTMCKHFICSLFLNQSPFIPRANKIMKFWYNEQKSSKKIKKNTVYTNAIAVTAVQFKTMLKKAKMPVPGIQTEGGLGLSTRQCSIPFSKCTYREAAQLTSFCGKKTTFDKNKIKRPSVWWHSAF